MTAEAQRVLDLDLDLGTLRISGVDPRRTGRGNAWVFGTLAGHTFYAKILQTHAPHVSFELGQSRISNLELFRNADITMVAKFDRGWDLRPDNPKALAIVDRLSKHLAPLADPVAWNPGFFVLQCVQDQSLRLRRSR